MSRIFRNIQRDKTPPVKRSGPLERIDVFFGRDISGLMMALLCLGLGACGGSQIAGLGDQFSPINRAHLFAADQRSMYAGVAIVDQGGNAADATIAMIIQAQLSQPGRMSLHQGGMCLGYDGATAIPFALDYSADSFSQWSGLLALHARFGRLPMTALVQPALRHRQHSPLSRALIVWAQNPQRFAQLHPFRDNAQTARWQQKPAFSSPLGVDVDDEIIIAIDHPTQRTLVEDRPVSLPQTPARPIVVGSLDRDGLGVVCVTNPMPNTIASVDEFGIAEPWSAPVQYALPLLGVDYNANNRKLKWIAAFSAAIPAQAIIENHQSLHGDALNRLPDNAGYVLSYCPAGLPHTSSLREVPCASYSGNASALGWVSRQ